MSKMSEMESLSKFQDNAQLYNTISSSQKSHADLGTSEKQHGTVLQNSQGQSVGIMNQMSSFSQQSVLLFSQDSTYMVGSQTQKLYSSYLSNSQDPNNLIEVVGNIQFCGYHLFSVKSREIKIEKIELSSNILTEPLIISRPEKIEAKQTAMDLFSISSEYKLKPLCSNKLMRRANVSQKIEVGSKFQLSNFFFKVERIKVSTMEIKISVRDCLNKFNDVGEIKVRADYSKTIRIGTETFSDIFKQGSDHGYMVGNHAYISFEDGENVFLKSSPQPEHALVNGYDYFVWWFLNKDNPEDEIDLYDNLQIKVSFFDLIQFTQINKSRV